MTRTIVFLVVLMVNQSLCFAQHGIAQDERMHWWREAKFGMFIHWGLYAIPAGEWKGKTYPQIGEWIMLNAKIPHSEYQQLAAQFNPTQFNARDVVAAAKGAGMKYLAITAKHHDGFAMFKSNASPYNIVDATPYGKDVVKMLADECRKQSLKFCFYYSHARDWNERDGLGNNWDFPSERNFQKYLDEKVKPQLTELLTNYGPISLIWFDTPMSISNEQAQTLKDLVRKLQPACIISGRLGGDVETDYRSTGDNVIPPMNVSGDWEVPATLNNTWGYKKNDHEWKSPETIERYLFDIVAKGGNYLLNVGPTADGIVPQPSVEILKHVGKWMKVNSESIYGAKANPFNVEFTWGNVTQKNGKLYLGIFNWPKNEFLLDGLKSKVEKIYLLSDKKKKALPFKQLNDKEKGVFKVSVALPTQAPDRAVSVVVVEVEGEVETVVNKSSENEKDIKRYFEY
jgi:alpha-L-fucosidase